jgi:hypothetical protein
MALIFITISAALAYFARAGFDSGTLRFTYKLFLFILLWKLLPKIPQSSILFGIKLTIWIWFIAAVGQYVFLLLGWDISLFGRFVSGRGGVPSLTPEPSFYGTISVILLVYLMSARQRVSRIYYLMSMSALALSGSLLPLIAFSGVAIFRAPFRVKLIMAAAVFALIVFVLGHADIPYVRRLVFFLSSGGNLSGLLFDYSVNLRLGHILFSLYANIPEELYFGSAASFQNAYNAWASSTGIFFPTGSDFILASLGDLIYGGGFFGLGIAIVILVHSWRTVRRLKHRLFKVGFVMFLLLNPVSISNTFFLLYVLQRDRDPEKAGAH